MKTVTKKEMTIFLASSAELRKDRDLFGDFVQHLNNHYANRGLFFQLDKWEYFDSLNAFNDNRTQSEYNKHIEACDVFVCLFYTKAGKFTQEEFDIAMGECHKRKLPLFISMRDLEEGVTEEDSLTQFKERLKKMEYFWLSYGTNDKLHLDFVLWLDSYIFDGKSPIKVENGHVMLEDIKVADMSGLSFAANNDAFKKMYQEIQDYPAKIEKLYKENNSKDKLKQALDHYKEQTEEFERYQQALLDTAKFIADRKHEQSSEKLQRAIDAFESGDMAGANAILKEIEIEAEREGHLEHFERQKNISDKAQEVVHQDVDAFQLQAKTEMADLSTPIEERIARVAKIYAKADDWASRSAYDKEKYAKLLFDYAQFHNKYGHYPEAKQIYLRQIPMSEELYGTNSTDTATSYNEIGLVYNSKGDYEKALEYYVKALDIREKVLGKEHPDTATSYNNIGTVYDDKGDYDKALEYYFKALDIHENVLGKEHPSTATSYNNIGLVYCKQGIYDKALEYYFKALHIDEKVLGKEHPNTATSYNNIAGVYYSKGDYDKALEYYFKALDIVRKVLGEMHPYSASTYNNVGSVYRKQSIYDKALEYHFKALDIREKVLGKEHPDTAIDYNNIGLVYKSKGDYDKALEYYEKALSILLKVLGTEHPSTKTVQGNIDSLMK